MTDEYIFGYHNEEIKRLGQQHAIWLEVCRSHWQDAGFAPGMQILDLGCGPGFASFELAKIVTNSGRIYALDGSKDYLNVLQQEKTNHQIQHIELLTCDVNAIPLADGCLDAIYARWLMTFIKTLPPLIEHAYRLLKPGGRFAIMDYFIWQSLCYGPCQESLPAIREAVLKSFTAHHTDGCVGQKILPVLTDQGFNLHTLKPLVFLARPNEPYWQWFENWGQVYFPQLVEKGFLQDQNFKLWQEDMQNNKIHPAGFFMTPEQIAIVAEK